MLGNSSAGDKIQDESVLATVKQSPLCNFLKLGNDSCDPLCNPLSSLHNNPDSVLFHGSNFSFELPSKKHRKEYNNNARINHQFFESLTLKLAKNNNNNEITSSGYNLLRRHSDMLFHPIVTDEAAFPLYINPWTSSEVGLSGLKSPKIKQFTMTNCLFGASILGIDEHGNKYPLVDHHLTVKDTIIQVQVDDNPHPYESMSFAALQGLLPLIKCMGIEDCSIRYHLPKLDYALYGLHLYIAGKVTFDALESFIQHIQIRALKHQEIICDIAAQAGVAICIESPFDNLFPEELTLTADNLLGLLCLTDEQIKRLQDNHPKFSAALSRAARRGGHTIFDFKWIIEVFNAIDEFVDTSKSIDADISSSPRILFEELCIENIIKHLTTNNSNEVYKQVWQNIQSDQAISRFSPLQQLFKVANVAFIARACMEYNDFEVCSLLPVDEKPIVLAYKELLSVSFGHVLCLSWFPPILNYVTHEDNSLCGNHKNNLFRLRPDLYKIDQAKIREYLSGYFNLPQNFWANVDKSFIDSTKAAHLTIQVSEPEAVPERVRASFFAPPSVLDNPEESLKLTTP